MSRPVLVIGLNSRHLVTEDLTPDEHDELQSLAQDWVDSGEGIRTGAFYCDLGTDGNFEIGRRLTEDERLSIDTFLDQITRGQS